jgi:hypothetical protein
MKLAVRSESYAATAVTRVSAEAAISPALDTSFMGNHFGRQRGSGQRWG